MANDAPMNCLLDIDAPPGTVVKVRYRGSQGQDEDENNAVVHEGPIPAGGQLVLPVPCGNLVVLAKGYETGIANFDGESGQRRVTLKENKT